MDFPSLADLEVALAEAELRDELDDVVQDARPGVRFLRGKILDARLPSGASKLGGYPDLREGFPWPMADPFPDAAQRADTLDELDAMLRRYGNSQDGSLAMRKAALFQPFPLAFAGQLDLQALSAQAGFDQQLPSRGLLSFFIDLRDQGSTGVRVLWFDQPAATLRRSSHPEALLDYYDRENATGGFKPLSGHAEALHPFSVLTIREDRPDNRPHHDEFVEWCEMQPRWPHPELPVDRATEQTGVFLDSFCGWPHLVQDDPCNAMEGGPAQWHSLFTWTKESHGGCFMSAHQAPDALCYVVIRKDDLAAEDFSRTRVVVTD